MMRTSILIVCASPDAFELALLQHAQQLRLERRAHGPDLVEEQRAPVRLLEPPLAVADGAGERAAHVAEQLRLEQRFRDRAAVERHEPVGAPRAVVMDRARGEFLAGAGLARDEHGARRRGDGLQQLEQIAHHAAPADETVDPVPFLELRSQVGVLGLAGGAARAPSGCTCSSASNWNGFVMKSAAPCLMASTASFTVPKPVIDDGDDVGVPLERRVQHRAAVDAGQPEVGDDDVEREFREPRERLLAAGGLLDREAVIGEPLGNRLPQRRLVVYDQQMFRAFRHLVGGRYFDTRPTGGQRTFPARCSTGEPRPRFR